jgi:hypothetical protein
MKWKKEIDEWEEECKAESDLHGSYDKKDPNMRKKGGYIRPNYYRNQGFADFQYFLS